MICLSRYQLRIYRVSTGINELDEALEGGIPKGSWVAITGEPGTGKSIMCMHYAYKGLKEGDPVIYVTTEAEFRDVVRQAEQFGMNFEEYEIHYLGGEVPTRRPNIVVIDIFSLLKMAKQLTSEFSAEGERRRRYAALDIETLVAAITEAYQVLGLTTEGRRTPLRHVRLIIDSLSAFWADKPAMARKYSYQLKIATHRDNVTAYLVSQYAMTTKSVGKDELINIKLNNEEFEITLKDLEDTIGLKYSEAFNVAIPVNYNVRVKSLNLNNYRITWSPIRALIKHKSHGVAYEVELSDGKSAILTSDHGLLKKFRDTLSFTPIRYLSRGDEVVINQHGLKYVKVRNIREIRYRDFVYDLSVKPHENFLLKCGLIIHNSTFGFGLEHIADGVIHLWMDNVEEAKHVRRYLIVKKMRMTNHYTGAFILNIEPGKGIILKKL